MGRVGETPRPLGAAAWLQVVMMEAKSIDIVEVPLVVTNSLLSEAHRDVPSKTDALEDVNFPSKQPE